MRSKFGQRSWRKFIFVSLFAMFVMAVLFWNHPDHNSQDLPIPETLQLIRKKLRSIQSTRQTTPSQADTIQWCSSKLKFLDGSDKLQRTQQKSDLVGLVSFPGSGNTWLRYLLQQSTGIFTGSVYVDGELRKNGLLSVQSPLALVVKTHEVDEQSLAKFTKVILLVRDPAQAILAEFNRLNTKSHVASVDMNKFSEDGGKTWSRFVRKQLEKWERTNLIWATEFSGQVKIVRYEDLVTNLDATLRGILKFLNRPVDEKLLNCTLSKKEGNYKRPKITKEVFDPYSDKLLQMIAKKKREVFDKILSGR